MYNFGSGHDLTPFLDPRYGLIIPTITAAAGNDNTFVNGPAIDRLASNRFLHTGLVAVVFGVTTLASAETLKFSLKIHEAAASNFSGSTDLYDSGALATLLTGVQTAKEFVTMINIPNFEKARQYVRASLKFDLSASGTDTVLGGVALILIGASNQPAV